MLVDFSNPKSKELKIQKEKDIVFAMEVKKRDLWLCSICGSPFHPNAHHIIPRENKEYRHLANNGITLCTKHHKFSRVISAHNNPLAFFLWLEKYRNDLFTLAKSRTLELIKKEGINVTA